MNFMAPFLRAQSYKCDTPLIAAIHARDINGAKKLIDSGVELNAKDCGTTPLIESIASHQPAIAEKLILAGASAAVGDSKNALLHGIANRK